MRILSVRFQNLNSLAGEWTVDLTAPEFTGNGIFAITGPTGAGKTTILDAICLGLYGRTPRLDRVNDSANEIMTQGTGACFSEVTFETAEGRFSCMWSQHRARNKVEGKLQPSKHEISDAEGALLHEKKTGVAHEIEKVTGMDFERFTRSMMLAQGDFAAFLNAKPDERAPILEQITGTDIYSTISTHVHVLTAQQDQKLVELQAELGAIDLLTPEAEADLRSDLADTSAVKEQLDAQIAELGRALEWWSRRDMLTTQLEEATTRETQAAAAHAEFAPQRLQLQRALAALELEADFRTLARVRSELSAERDKVANISEQLPLARVQLETAASDERSAATDLQAAKKAKDAAEPKITSARTLDTQITGVLARLEQLDKVIVGLQQRRAKLTAERATHGDALATAEKRAGDVQRWLTEHESDAGLAAEAAGIIARIEEFTRRVDEVAAAVIAEREAVATLQACDGALTDAHEHVDAAKTEVRRAGDAFTDHERALAELLAGRTLVAWRRDKDDATWVANKLTHALSQLNTAREQYERAQKFATHVAEHSRSVADLTAKLQDLQTQLEDANVLLDLSEQHAAQAMRMRTYEEAREQLVDDQECPLCGSLDHPFARGNVPVLNDAEAALAAAKRDKEEVVKQINVVGQQLVAAQKDQESAAASLHEAEQGRDSALGTYAEVLQTVLARESDAGAEPEAAQATNRGPLRLPDLLPAHVAISDQLARVPLAESGLSTELAAELDAAIARMSAIDEECARVLKATAAIDIALKSAREERDRATAHEAKAHIALATAEAKRESARSDAKAKAEQVVVLRAEITSRAANVAKDVGRYGLTLLADSAGAEVRDCAETHGLYDDPAAWHDRASTITSTLLDRRAAWQRHSDELRSLASGMQNTRTQLEAVSTSIKEVDEQVRERTTEHEQESSELERLRAKRSEILGDLDPDLQWAQLGDSLKAAMEHHERMRSTLTSVTRVVDGLTDDIDRLTASLTSRASELQQLEGGFSASLATSEFAGEAAYSEALLPQEARAELQRQASALDLELTDATRQTVETARQLERVVAEAVTEVPADELRSRRQQADTDRTVADKRMWALDQQLKDNERHKVDAGAMLAAISAQKRECARWSNLHALIGSADGKKFRNFAQGLTFEILISHANQQLQRMSDRYLLAPGQQERLSLSVIDNYQGGELRSTRNLSGGESFIVSLALALGLSRMASRNVRVDSLFLDEGFGTLDEEALDTALDTLASLHQEGKMIGIISHVPVLKERISTRISVTPTAGGRSALSGPGCSRGRG